MPLGVWAAPASTCLSEALQSLKVQSIQPKLTQIDELRALYRDVVREAKRVGDDWSPKEYLAKPPKGVSAQEDYGNQMVTLQVAIDHLIRKMSLSALNELYGPIPETSMQDLDRVLIGLNDIKRSTERYGWPYRSKVFDLPTQDEVAVFVEFAGIEKRSKRLDAISKKLEKVTQDDERHNKLTEHFLGADANPFWCCEGFCSVCPLNRIGKHAWKASGEKRPDFMSKKHQELKERLSKILGK